MPKFLAVHPVGAELTLEAGEPIAKAIKAGLNADAYWVSSVYAQEEGKLYCQWDAKDVEIYPRCSEKDSARVSN